MSAAGRADVSQGEGELPATLVTALERACDRFEAACRAGLRPRIEDYLGAEAEPGRPALFRELVQSEWEYRRRLGERPAAEEYRARFPDSASQIDELFGGESGESGKPAPDGGKG